jgi:serine/threonine protein kinase
VFKAVEKKTKRKVAIKKMWSDNKALTTESIINEIAIMKSCKHPNIIEFIDAYRITLVSNAAQGTSGNGAAGAGSSSGSGGRQQIWVVMEFMVKHFADSSVVAHKTLCGNRKEDP